MAVQGCVCDLEFQQTSAGLQNIPDDQLPSTFQGSEFDSQSLRGRLLHFLFFIFLLGVGGASLCLQGRHGQAAGRSLGNLSRHDSNPIRTEFSFRTLRYCQSLPAAELGWLVCRV